VGEAVMMKFIPALLLLVVSSTNPANTTATVRIEPSTTLKGPRVLEEQTASGAIRDYLQSWQSLNAALQQNRADLLDSDFVGTARSKLGKTVETQAQLGLRTQSQDTSHDIQIVFYSPEGMSIELTDTVEYTVNLLDHDKIVTSNHMRCHYVVIMTPTESRWKVRVFQTES
jgi:hypothetical protein